MAYKTNLQKAVTNTNQALKEGKLDDIHPYEVNGSFIRSFLPPGEIPHVGCDHVFMPANTSLPPHLHQRSKTYLLVTSGRGYGIIGDQHISIKKGDIICIEPQVVHSFSTESESIEFISIQSPPISDENGNVDYVLMLSVE
ncbi:hypothetical protein NIES4072_70010 [Nostoc commune NIES-4072]|uniref:Cupin type-2 domain-containing protein n=1 Tax=Nostoc commune NIES-4072 TaxID=2005467 RepID=A0A2R5FZ09_NOSCO|nr:cupin domain-containing protein [Nostoc commune]BBD70634.1 hypothetical protein NIES4070_70450 [Nostoc commune HK-02]GBG23289.1 hypothetical protein NIES4072_70010 [Nostoc commune NIES-4072]